MKVKVDSTGVFIGSQELLRLRESLDDKGFRKALLDNSSSFGLIYNPKEEFLNGLVRVSSGNKIDVLPVKGIDKDGNFLVTTDTITLSIPNDGKPYWVIASYKETNEEIGEYSIDVNGNLTCTTGNGELTKILRGQPNYPSRVKFIGSTYNTLEYDVLSVIDDNNAVLQGNFTQESGLKLVVVGTFPPGFIPIQQHKDIFIYDSCEIKLVQTNSLSIPPTLIQDKEFLLGVAVNNGGNLTIEDRREQIYTTHSRELLRAIESTPSIVVGVEKITYSNIKSTKTKNNVWVGWGLRTNNWTFNSNLNSVTFLSAEGGRFKPNDLSLFVNGDFDGWYIYTSNGNRYKVVSSQKNGSQLNFTLENTLSSDFSNQSQQLVLAPDAEEIEFIFTPDPGSGNQIDRKIFVFPIGEGVGKCEVPIFGNSSSYNIVYRYKWGKIYSPIFTPQDDNIGYYNERQFDENGQLVNLPSRTPYTTDPVNGYISLIAHQDTYTVFKDRVDLGDILGWDNGALTQSGKTLITGTHKVHQILTMQSQTLGGPVDITLKDVNNAGNSLKDGNKFYLYLFLEDIQFNGNSIRVVQPPPPLSPNPIVLFEIKEETFASDWGNKGLPILLKCVWDSVQGKWYVFKQTEWNPEDFWIKKDYLENGGTVTAYGKDNAGTTVHTMTGSKLTASGGLLGANSDTYFIVQKSGNKYKIFFHLQVSIDAGPSPGSPTTGAFTYVEIPLSSFNIPPTNGAFKGSVFISHNVSSAVTEGEGVLVVKNNSILMFKSTLATTLTQAPSTSVRVNVFSPPYWNKQYIDGSPANTSGTYTEWWVGEVEFEII